MARFAFREAWLPVWAPDGKRLAFSTGPTDIYEKSTEGTGQEALVLRGGTNVVPLDWSPDGKWILFAQQDPANGSDLWLVAADGSHAAMPYLHERFNEQSGVFSPDGHWVAYESDESGKTQIYVQAMPAGGAKYQISIDGGTSPEWRRDGKELFFVSQDQTLMAAPIALDARVDAGVPQRLFPGVDSAFAVSRDGQRILLNVPAEGGSRVIPPITVVSNWPASLNP
jgi:Tol biopolymer transport system component